MQVTINKANGLCGAAAIDWHAINWHKSFAMLKNPKQTTRRGCKLLINTLNPKIRGWADYYRTVVSKVIFYNLDEWLRQRQLRYIAHMHPKKSFAWRRRKYWGRLNLDRQDNWVFGEKQTGMHMTKFGWTNCTASACQRQGITR